ncbi:MAG: protein kinase, partial [Myxococcales bacterium]|nr:protein kinase [Myxococcales bacterium]
MSTENDRSAAPPDWLRQAAATPSEPPAPAVPGLPQVGQVVAGKYRIDGMLGRGGMGAVFRATHTLMNKPVALKWLVPDLSARAEMRRRFVLEAQVAGRIDHPNVVDVYDVGTEADGLFMVMELLEGESLTELLERGQIPIPDLLQLLVQAMWGVAAAHDAGVIHRDIKPDNIFVLHDPTQPAGLRAKVLDFGISKLTSDSMVGTGVTKSGVTMGTPAYMPHEQINSARDVDARADVYAFGVLMYRALTGRLPFIGETFGAMAVAIATHTATPPKALRPDLPAALSEAVMKAMARNPDERFSSVRELLDVLRSLSTAEAYLGHMTNPATVPPSVTPVADPAEARADQADGVSTDAVGDIPSARRTRSAIEVPGRRRGWSPWGMPALAALSVSGAIGGAAWFAQPLPMRTRGAADTVELAAEVIGGSFPAAPKPQRATASPSRGAVGVPSEPARPPSR